VVVIEVRNLQQFRRLFRRMEDNFKNMNPMFDKLAEDFREVQEKTFETSGRYNRNVRWQRLSPSYKTWKNEVAPGKPILTLTGGLRNSFTRQGGYHIERRTSNTLDIGSNHPLGKYHQRGTNKMPARPVINLTQTQAKKWAKVAAKVVFKFN
jgi:phage gpG-like protein